MILSYPLALSSHLAHAWPFFPFFKQNRIASYQQKQTSFHPLKTFPFVSLCSVWAHYKLQQQDKNPCSCKISSRKLPSFFRFNSNGFNLVQQRHIPAKVTLARWNTKAIFNTADSYFELHRTALFGETAYKKHDSKLVSRASTTAFSWTSLMKSVGTYVKAAWELIVLQRLAVSQTSELLESPSKSLSEKTSK